MKRVPCGVNEERDLIIVLRKRGLTRRINE